MANEAKLDDRQTHVVDALQNRNEKLAGLYATALDILAAKAIPPREAARISIICHCMRELMIGLPAVMSDFSIPRPAPSSATLLRQLPELLAAHPEADLRLDQDLVPVPRAVALALTSLLNTASKEEARNRANAATLVTGMPQTKHPVIEQWTKAYEFFVGWTHLDRNHDRQRPLPKDETLLAHMRVVEDVIEVRSSLFFENLHALEDLLAEINAVDDGDS
ncbi:hypothetical protein [Glutamicibacter arilaitensis]|uniref:hypothetical protein n=1 Tax=Glutamicibacter arilaitensis TaxID=256701 RepID=UPI003F937704